MSSGFPQPGSNYQADSQQGYPAYPAYPPPQNNHAYNPASNAHSQPYPPQQQHQQQQQYVSPNTAYPISNSNKPHGYPPGSAPYPGQHAGGNFADLASESGIRPVPSGINDLWALLLFLFCSVIAIGASGFFSLQIMSTSSKGLAVSANSGGQFSANAFIAPSIGGIIASLFCLFSYVFFLTRYPVGTITFMIWANIFFGFVSAAFAFFAKIIPLGVFFLVMVILTIVWYFCIRSQIPLAAYLISSVTKVLNRFQATYFVSSILSIMSGFYVLLISVPVFYVASAAVDEDKTRHNEFKRLQVAANASAIFVLFYIFWSFAVVRNTVHVTISSLMGNHYFNSHRRGGMGLNPTGSALKLAVTKAIGSICYGSLLIAVVQFLKYLVRRAANDRDSVVALFISCIIQAILSCIEGIIEFVNTYAFVYVATRHIPFCDAAKSTWELIKSRGFEVIVNNNIMGFVSTTSTLLAVYFVSICVSIIVLLQGNGESQAYTILVAFPISLLVAFLFFIFNKTVSSGVAAKFVFVAEDPNILREHHPEEYGKYRAAYPDVPCFSSMA